MKEDLLERLIASVIMLCATAVAITGILILTQTDCHLTPPSKVIDNNNV